MSERSDSKRKELEIDILSVNSWTMHAQVAETFTNEDLNVFLAGDAAHRFPPAGSFYEQAFIVIDWIDTCMYVYMYASLIIC